jgi:glycosyltransferase involved in cell wall biosynthesis
MTGEPLVSVAMPLYNAAADLERSLGLIRNQTYHNLEIFLCDNASTDATQQICERAAAEDSRIRYVRQPRNLGPAANFNLGLQLKRGDYFMWAAHDDEKLPDFVAECLAALQAHRSASMACTTTVLITANGEQIHQPYPPTIASDDFAERLTAFVSDTQVFAFYGLYRSAVVDDIGPADVWLDADRRYLFKAILRGPFEVVPKPLFRFRWTNTSDNYIAAGFRMRPGATDFDLDLYHHLPQLMREAGVEASEVRRAMRSMMVPLHPYFERRAAWLVSRALHDELPRRERTRLLFAWARQYPPLFRSRMFWGALRRVMLGR